MVKILSPFPTALKLLLGGLGIIALVWFISAVPAQAASMNNQAQQQVILDAPAAQVLPAAQQAFQQWNRGEFVSVDEENMQVVGLSRTNFFKFVDDITVSLKSADADLNKTQIEISSVGRMGEYDFGGNQRNIDEYLTTLKQILALS